MRIGLKERRQGTVAYLHIFDRELFFKPTPLFLMALLVCVMGRSTLASLSALLALRRRPVRLRCTLRCCRPRTLKRGALRCDICVSSPVHVTRAPLHRS